MSSYSAPTGKANWCSSQKERRKTLLQAIRSPVSSRSREMWVRSRVVAIGTRNMGDCWSLPSVRSRSTLPDARSEPVSSRAPTSSSYARGGTMSSLSTNAR